MADDQQAPDVATATQLAVISTQLGALQQALDTGLQQMERRLNRHSEEIGDLRDWRIRVQERERERARSGREAQDSQRVTLSRRQILAGGVVGAATVVLGIVDAFRA